MVISSLSYSQVILLLLLLLNSTSLLSIDNELLVNVSDIKDDLTSENIQANLDEFNMSNFLTLANKLLSFGMMDL